MTVLGYISRNLFSSMPSCHARSKLRRRQCKCYATEWMFVDWTELWS